MLRISVTVVNGGDDLDGRVIPMDVAPELTIADLKGFIQAHTAVEPAIQSLYFNNRTIREDGQTIESLGIKDGDLIAMVVNPDGQPADPRSASRQQPQTIEQMRQRMLADPGVMNQVRNQQPALVDAVNDPARFQAVWEEMSRGDRQRQQERQQELAMLNADAMNVESQRKIEEMIRQEQVMKNLEFAYQHSPEVFGRVTMLYVPVTVNNHPVKAFVDSGAQTTIMSPSCAESCNIMRLIDRRYSGIAKGVGTAQILGRVHAADITIGNSSMTCSFTVMEGKDVDLLLGLDMLKRFQAIIDLKQNKLIFGDGNEVTFLGESEIPKFMDDAQQSEPTVSGPAGTEIGAKSGTVKPAGTSAAASAAAASSSSGAGSAFRGQGKTLGAGSGAGAASPAKPAATSNLAQRPAASQSSSASTSRYPRADIERLVQLGFSEEQAVQALFACGGNVEYAAGLLFSS